MLNKNTLIVGLLVVCAGMLAYSIGFSSGQASAVEAGMAIQSDISQSDHIPASLDNVPIQNIAFDDNDFLNETNQELPPELLAGVYRAVKEVLQQELHREIRIALDAVLPEILANINYPKESNHDPEQIESIVSQAELLVDEAIDRGVWGSEDEKTLATAIQSVPDGAMIDVSRQLSQAINEGRLVINPEAIFGLQ